MIVHYLKIAVRNLLKYKVQSAISIFGLAVGFVCFALSAMWIRYEMTYDNFHRDAERIYLLQTNDIYTSSRFYNFFPQPLAKDLKEQYPEIEDYATLRHMEPFLQREHGQETCEMASPDSTFMRMMDIRILRGNANFTLPQSKEVAITEEMAEKLFPGEDPIGKEVTLSSQKKTVCAVVTDWSRHSSFHYDFMGNDNMRFGWEYSSHLVLMKLKKGVDPDALLEKMNRNFPEVLMKNRHGETHHRRFYLAPLTSLRYNKGYLSQDDAVIKFNYIVYFSVAGILIIVCALVNYLSLFFNRLRTRRKEMVLRKVNGASGSSLISLLLTEYVLTFIAAILVGMTLIEVLMPSFLEYSGILASRDAIYMESFVYFAILSVVASVFALIPIYLFQKRTLQHNLKGSQGNRTENLWRKASIVVQLAVCLAVIGGTVLMNKQLNHLKHADLGMEHENIGSVSIWIGVDMNTWMDRIQNLPMVTEALPPKYYPLVGTGPMEATEVNRWDGQDKPLDSPMVISIIYGGEEFFRFYGMTLLAGEWITEKSGLDEIVITETTARDMGWTPEEAVGKHIQKDEEAAYTIVGVAKDCQYLAPTVKVPYTGFINTEKQKWQWFRASILFKYKEGTWDECRRLIEEMYRQEHPDKLLRLFSEEETYNKYLRSENALGQLLSFASLMCIVISLFGIYSLVTLTCEQRRKEIAIRKVNGATVRDIVGMFFREYLTILAVSALVAFPVTYVIVKQWIEGYNRQTDIGLLPFVTILAGIAVIVSITIGWRVWQTATENPADVVKSE